MSVSKDFLSLIAIFEIPLPTCYFIKIILFQDNFNKGMKFFFEWTELN